MAGRRRTRALASMLVLGALLASAAGAGALDDLDRAVGRALFKRLWVPAPASTRGDDGLGPLMDARSCAACHPAGKSGSAALDPEGRPAAHGLVVALARPDGGSDPAYGQRLESEAIPGHAPEGRIAVRVTTDAQGRQARTLILSNLAYGPLAADTKAGLRLAPDLRGRGLISHVDDAAILALEDPDGRDRDGVRGRARRLPGPDGATALGRYGWKAGHATLDDQISEAFSLDLGLSTPLRPAPWGDCTPTQAACRAAPHGGGAGPEPDGLEIGAPVFARLVAYVAALPLPEARPDPKGARLFAATGCATCHRPDLPLRDGGRAALFTDLLLHDLGAGLDDGLSVPGAAGREWRTAPLAGLSDALARGTGLLHDGRARDVAAAIAWHGGEAAGAVARFGALAPADRSTLLRYVSGL